MGFTYEAPAVPARASAPAGGHTAWAGGLKGALQRARGPSARQELPAFTRQLATLLHAGTNAPEALETLRPGVVSRELRAAVEALELDTKRGLALSAAMRLHPNVFSRVYTEVVEAGEQAGTLDRMLDPLAANLLLDERMRRKTTRAMSYPAFSLGATVIGGWYLLGNVVPTFASIYEREGADLPAITRVLVALSHAASHAGELGLLVVVASLFALSRVVARPAVRARIDAVTLRIPVVSRLARARANSNFMRYFALLLSTESTPEVDAIQLAAQTAPNAVLAARLAGAAAEVAKGAARISTALADTGVVPPIWGQVIQTGEKSGRLAEQARYAAERLEEETQEVMEAMQGAAGHAAMAIVAGAVGFLVVGIYAPMANLYQVLLK
jgi:type II secretory pathway component PulF